MGLLTAEGYKVQCVTAPPCLVSSSGAPPFHSKLQKLVMAGSVRDMVVMNNHHLVSSRTSVTDRSLELLASLSTLAHLDVTDSKVSAAGSLDFRLQRPHVLLVADHLLEDQEMQEQDLSEENCDEAPM